MASVGEDALAMPRVRCRLIWSAGMEKVGSQLRSLSQNFTIAVFECCASCLHAAIPRPEPILFCKFRSTAGGYIA